MTHTEKQIAKMARSMAKLAHKLRRAGDLEGYERVIAAGIQTADAMRAGRV